MDETPITRHGKSDLFREEAVREYLRAHDPQEVIRLSPRWIEVVYYVLIAAAFVGLLFGLLADIDEYASGRAVVMPDSLTNLVSPTAGTVAAVMAIPGGRVSAGEVLARVESLGYPHGIQILAPHDGFTHDISIHLGQTLLRGAPMLSLVQQNQSYHIVAALPGRYRAFLAPGQTIQFRMHDAGTACEFEVTNVGVDFLSPDEARRFLPADPNTPQANAGSLIAIRGASRAAKDTLGAPGLSPGLTGIAELRVGREPILFSLFPAIRSVLESVNE